MKNSSKLLLSSPQPRYPGCRYTVLSPKQQLHSAMLATCFVQQDDSQVLCGCCETGSQHRQCLSLWQAFCLSLFGVLEYGTGQVYTWVNLLSGRVNFSKRNHLSQNLESHYLYVLGSPSSALIQIPFLLCVCLCVFVFVSLCVCFLLAIRTYILTRFNRMELSIGTNCKLLKQ